MKLYIDLLDGKQMVFELENHNVVDKFVELVSSIKAGSSKVDYESYCMWTAQNFPKIKIITELNESVDYFNHNNGYGEKLKPVLNGVLSELNDLHFEFEHAANRFLPNQLLSSDHNNAIEKLPPKCDDLELLAFHLNNINSKIHTLEFAVDLDKSKKRAYFSIFLRDMLNDTRSLPLNEEDYKLFSLDACFGDLMLGYGTTGKNLHHIYLNKDINFFKQGNRPSPQSAITTNILGWFSENQKHSEQIIYLNDWLSENFEEKFDIYNPKAAIGYIRLGKLLRTGPLEKLDDNQLINYYSDNTIIQYFIQ